MATPRLPMLLRQTPLRPDQVKEMGVREDMSYADARMLESPLRAGLWSGSYGTALAHARRAAALAARMPDADVYPAATYLGRGLTAAQDLLRTAADRTAAFVDRMLDADPEGPKLMRLENIVALRAALRRLLNWHALGLGEPPFTGADRAEALARSLAAEPGEDTVALGRYCHEVDAWRDLDRGRPDAARLIELYDPRDEDALEELGWNDLPSFELIYAVDQLRARGIPHSLDGVRSLPPFVVERGGWWV